MGNLICFCYESIDESAESAFSFHSCSLSDLQSLCESKSVIRLVTGKKSVDKSQDHNAVCASLRGL